MKIEIFKLLLVHINSFIVALNNFTCDVIAEQLVGNGYPSLPVWLYERAPCFAQYRVRALGQHFA